jgi:hypothetical protein
VLRSAVLVRNYRLGVSDYAGFCQQSLACKGYLIFTKLFNYSLHCIAHLIVHCIVHLIRALQS